MSRHLAKRNFQQSPVPGAAEKSPAPRQGGRFHPAEQPDQHHWHAVHQRTSGTDPDERRGQWPACRAVG
eukprot:8575027-Alexandrium_andersonii.AAC.1